VPADQVFPDTDPAALPGPLGPTADVALAELVPYAPAAEIAGTESADAGEDDYGPGLGDDGYGDEA
jgi:hypothetical protein